MKPRMFPATAIAIGSLALVAPAPKLQAQAAPGAQQGMQRLEEVSRQLQLSPQQRRQLMPILASEAPKVKAIRTDTSLSRMEKLRRLKALHDQNDPQVKAILTPDQYQTLREMRRKEIEQAINARQGE